MTDLTLFDDDGIDPARLIAANHLARDFYRHQLLDSDGPRRYLAGRGFAAVTRTALPWAVGADAPWHIGYAPAGPTALIDHLTALGFGLDELVDAGLATTSRAGRVIDVFRDRIVFPIHNLDGHTIAFVGRSAPGAKAGVPKYLNSRDSMIYHKGQTLYGVAEQAERIAAGWAPVIVEGPFDVLAVWLAHPDEAGIGRVAAATCGTAFTADHAILLAELPGAPRHGITTAFDNDTAGRKATVRAWHVLPIYTDISLYAASLPDGRDPADLHAVGQHGELRSALTHQSRPLVQAVIDISLDNLIARRPDLLDHVEGRVGAARHLANLLTDLPPEQIVALTAYLSERTHIGMDTAANVVVDAMETAPLPARPNPPAHPPPQPGPPGADLRRAPPRQRGRAFPPPGPPQAAKPAGPHPVSGISARPRRPRR